MPKPDSNLQEAINRFSAFLEEHKFRKTPERFSILETIYARNDHFDAETLFTDLQKEDKNISKATVYNTLELLVSCELVKSLNFGKNLTRYEKSFGFKQHDHMICVSCNKVVEFCDPRIQPIKTKMGELLDFRISGHSLNIYGMCGDCERGVENKSEGKSEEQAINS